MTYLHDPLILNEGQIEDYTLDRLHRLGEGYALGKSGFDVISPKEYITWVQRSLNRIYGAGLITDGRKTPSYKKLVRKFQSQHSLPEKGEVDSPTQNKIIFANEADRSYMNWVHRAIECDSISSASPRKTPNSRGSYKSYGLKLGIKEFQKKQGLGRDGFVGAKTEIKLVRCCKCLPPGHKKKKIKPPSPKLPDPLNTRQIKLLVWRLTGQRPKKASVGKLAVEFAKFVELQKLLRKPSLTSVFKHALRVYWKTVMSHFREEPRGKFGSLMGGAYAIMDVATGRKCTRRLKRGETRAQKIVASGFNQGYKQMCNHMRTLAADPDAKKLLDRLAKGTPHNVTVGRIYRALHSVAISEAGGKSLIYLQAREKCRFNYPRFKSSCKV
ncbi:MAG: hypothetical protein AAGC93_20315 [Cyanobacteria bacterium P01_F01_bin.53]